VSEYYNLKNIGDLLTKGFTKEELVDLCFYEPKFRPVYEQLSNSSKLEIIRQIIDYAHQKLQIEALLAWAKDQNPARYEEHQPYYLSASNEWPPIFSNDLGHGITIGGLYQDIPLQALAIGWTEYGDTLVKSGWLYIPQWSQCHAIAFFKIHIRNNGTGYIHIVDASHPMHTIWIETEIGFRKEQGFDYIAHATTIWDDLRWK
jgi:hypothetical protein